MQAAAKAEKAERIAQGLEPAEEEGPRYGIRHSLPDLSGSITVVHC